MSNFATLGIAVNATGVTNATAALNLLGQAATAAQNATAGLTGAAAQQAAALNAAANAALAAVNANRLLANQANQTAAGVRNVRNAMVQAGIQMQDFAIQVASGGNPLLAFVQQFSQLHQLSAVTGVSLRQIGANLLGLLNPLNVATGLIATIGAGLAVATYQFQESQLRVERAVSGIGRGSGVSVDAINRLAREQASAARVSVSAARDILASFVSMGNIDVSKFANLTQTTRNFAATIGENVPDAARIFARALQDPARGADLLNERLGGLDFRTRELIRTLQASGRTQEAQQVLYNTFIPQLRQAGELTNIFGRAWEYVATQAGAAADAIGRALSGPQTTSERYTDAVRRLDQARAGPQPRQTMYGPMAGGLRQDPAEIAAQQRRLRFLEEEAEHLNEVVRRERQAETAGQRRITQAAETVRAGEIARATNDPREQELRRLREEADRLRELANNPARAADAERAGGYQAIQLAYNTIQDQIRGMTDANGNLITSTQRVREEQQRTADQIERNYSPAQQRLNAINAERARLQEQGITGSEREARVTAAGDAAHRRATEGLQEASRERQLAARQNIETIRTETDMIGRSAGEQARMRFELQARQTLEQEARRNRLTPQEQEEELRYMRERSAEIERQTTAQQRQNVVSQANIDRRMLMMSDSEAAIARTLQPIYGRDFEAALRSSEAAMIRWNQTLKTIRDAGGEFFSTLARDLAEGVKPVEAMTNALKRMATTLLDMSVRSLWQQAFGMAMGGTGTTGMGNSFFSSIGGFFRSIFGGGVASASGNAFSNGQVIDTPTFHGMRGGGVGIAGEIGTEAILPLQRNAAGQLGVVADVGGGAGAGMVYAPQISFSPQLNIAMPEGADEEDGRRFGEAAMREMRGAFRSMLATELRPGGMLRQA